MSLINMDLKNLRQWIPREKYIDVTLDIAVLKGNYLGDRISRGITKKLSGELRNLMHYHFPQFEIKDCSVTVTTSDMGVIQVELPLWFSQGLDNRSNLEKFIYGE